MDWSKVDAGLAGALADDDGGGRFSVFVHLAGADDPDDPVLSALAGAGGPVRTGTLTGEEIGGLTERPDVRLVRLSAPVRPLDEC